MLDKFLELKKCIPTLKLELHGNMGTISIHGKMLIRTQGAATNEIINSVLAGMLAGFKAGVTYSVEYLKENKHLKS